LESERQVNSVFASSLRTLMIALFALIFGAQQIACACPPAHEMKAAHDHQAHASHASDQAHSQDQHDDNRGTCSHCETGSYLTAGSDQILTPALADTPISYFIPQKSLRFASYNPTHSPKPAIRDDSVRRLTPLQLKVRLLN